MSLLYTAAGAGTLVGLAALLAVHNPHHKGLLTIASGLAVAFALALVSSARRWPAWSSRPFGWLVPV